MSKKVDNTNLFIDHVSDFVTGRSLEQGVHGVEDLLGDDDVPFAQKTTSVLTFLAFKYDIESVLPFFGSSPMEFSEGVFKDVLAANVDSKVFTS